jgi:hypothetical protein
MCKLGSSFLSLARTCCILRPLVNSRGNRRAHRTRTRPSYLPEASVIFSMASNFRRLQQAFNLFTRSRSLEMDGSRIRLLEHEASPGTSSVKLLALRRCSRHAINMPRIGCHYAGSFRTAENRRQAEHAFRNLGHASTATRRADWSKYDAISWYHTKHHPFDRTT